MNTLSGQQAATTWERSVRRTSAVTESERRAESDATGGTTDV
jgi:hypothetical protein